LKTSKALPPDTTAPQDQSINRAKNKSAIPAASWTNHGPDQRQAVDLHHDRQQQPNEQHDH
jgi:hypothetical protein